MLDRIRELELELAAYRVYGTPLELAVALAEQKNKIEQTQ